MAEHKNFVDAMLERCLDRRKPVRCYMVNGFQVRGLVEDYNEEYLKLRMRDGGSRYLNRRLISTYEPNPPKPSEEFHGK